MTWKELCEKSKQLFGESCDCWHGLERDYIRITLNDNFWIFRQNGSIDIEFTIGKENIGSLDICYKKDYDQMYQMIEALKD